MVDYNTQRTVMSKPFNITTHKNTFTNYLELVLDEDGEAHYAVPSHKDWLLAYACVKFEKTRKQIEAMCPPDMYFDLITWLTNLTGCVAVWDVAINGKPNRKQKSMLQLLKIEGLYRGRV